MFEKLLSMVGTTSHVDNVDLWRKKRVLHDHQIVATHVRLSAGMREKPKGGGSVISSGGKNENDSITCKTTDIKMILYTTQSIKE